MAPRGQALPQATTESAREARKSFFCELCQKGYARMNDFEAHEGSYDHQHRKRLKEMRQLTKDPNAAAKARAAEQRANEEAGLKSINLSSVSTSTPASVKKKPVFKSTLQPHNVAAIAQITSKPMDVLDEDDDPSGAVGGGWYEERYRPSSPTKCTHDPKCESDITSEDLRQLVLEWRALEKGGDLNRLDGLRPLERGVDSNLLDRGVSLKPFEGDVIMKDS